MPFGDFVNQIPPAGFLAIHIVLFLIGAYFAWRSFGAGRVAAGYGFSLFALAELSYMTYHLNWTTFLFAHTISEVSISWHSCSCSRLRDAARARRVAQPGLTR